MPQFLAAEELDVEPKTKADFHPEMHTDVLVIGAGPTGVELSGGGSGDSCAAQGWGRKKNLGSFKVAE